MKSLNDIKNEYAKSKNTKNWDDFCFVANDNMFVNAVDEIARLYAEYCARFILNPRPLSLLDNIDLPGVKRFA